MKLTPLLLLCLLMSCKPQQSKTGNPDSSLVPIVDYAPNPDDVVLRLKLVVAQQNNKEGEVKVEVLKQLNAGSGFKNRLSPGDIITLYSSKPLPVEAFYCVVEFQISPSGGTYTLKSFLRK